MPRSGASNKIALEEKGQRATRSTMPYQQKAGHPEPTFCRKCGAVYHNKRWVIDSEKLAEIKQAAGTATTTCPSCQRMADDNPAGVVTLKGSYLLSHEDEILNIVKQTEGQSRSKNPLGRIMEIRQEEDLITIATTEEKLAQKIGRQIYKSHRGQLHYQWSHGNNLVRVNWER